MTTVVATKPAPDRETRPGRWVAAARKQAGLTQLKLALRVGRDPNTVARWERGRIDYVAWVGVLTLLGLPPGWEPKGDERDRFLDDTPLSPEPKTRPRFLTLVREHGIKGRPHPEDDNALVPFMACKAAAGALERGQVVKPQAWLEVLGDEVDAFKLRAVADKLIVVEVAGDSMYPDLHDEEWMAMLPCVGELPDGEIVLAECEGKGDPELDQRYAVKRLRVRGEGEKRRITLKSTNPESDDIEILPSEAHRFRVLAKLVALVDRARARTDDEG